MKARALLVALIVLLALHLSDATAQSTIPNGVFVRDSTGQDWLIVRGKRVAVPLWTAADADLFALPTDQQWAVLSVTDDGAMVAGSRPAWLGAQVAAPIAAPPAPAPSVGTPGQLTADLVYQWLGKDHRYVVGAALIANRTDSPLVGVRVRYDALDGAGVVLGSSATTLPGLPPGATLTHVDSAAASAQDVQVQSLRLTLENPGKAPPLQAYVTFQPFASTDVRFTRYESSDKTRSAFKVSGTVTNTGLEMNRLSVMTVFLLRDATGSIVGAARSSWISNAPESIPNGMAIRVESDPIDVTGVPSQAEVIAYQKS